MGFEVNEKCFTLKHRLVDCFVAPTLKEDENT